MLKVKSETGFAIQGTGRRFDFKQGEIVAYEIFEKEFKSKEEGQVILKGLLGEKDLEEIPEGTKAAQEADKGNDGDTDKPLTAKEKKEKEKAEKEAAKKAAQEAEGK